jgi:hypothetical protein
MSDELNRYKQPQTVIDALLKALELEHEQTCLDEYGMPPKDLGDEHLPCPTCALLSRIRKGEQ